MSKKTICALSALTIMLITAGFLRPAPATAMGQDDSARAPAVSNASTAPSVRSSRLPSFHKPNANLTKPYSLIKGGNLTGTITAITQGSYTLSITGTDGSVTTENISFNSKTKLSLFKPKNLPKPHSVIKPDLTKPASGKPPVFPLSRPARPTPPVAAPALEVGDIVRVKVKINADGSLYALAVHLAPTGSKGKNK